MIKKVFSVSDTNRLNYQFIKSISSRGYSKVPIYHGHKKDHIKGFLIT